MKRFHLATTFDGTGFAGPCREEIAACGQRTVRTMRTLGCGETALRSLATSARAMLERAAGAAE